MSMQINDGLKIIYNHDFLDKAENFKQVLKIVKVKPKRSGKLIEDNKFFQNIGIDVINNSFEMTEVMGKDDEIIIDFGKHLVGTIEFDIETIGSPPDAPLCFDLQFAEMPIEFTGTLESYNGWISKSWLQTAREHIDFPNCHYKNIRRYSFRYLKIKVWDTSPKYKVIFKNFLVNYTSVVGELDYKYSTNSNLMSIGEVSCSTLRNCMQDVYEDGPKRDRRLWLGDLYLQAVANYHSFKDENLIKRCLYLFAGSVDSEGRVAANLFVKPNVLPDDTYLVDYSLHFINTLSDYYQYTGDTNTVKELYQTAKNQVKFALKHTNEKNIFEEEDYWWAFFDWNDDLKKATAMQGLFIFTMKKMLALANQFDPDFVETCEQLIEDFTYSAEKYLFDKQHQLYICDDQFSMHSQIWMVLAECGSVDERVAILTNIIENKLDVKLITPYAQHFFVEALFSVGMSNEAQQLIEKYWGGMLKLGADTFWELFDPEDLESSPYGSHLANSYCHAWSCTPIYFIDKYIKETEQ